MVVLPFLWLASVPILLGGGWLLYRSFRKDPTDRKVEWSSEPVGDEGTEPEEDGTEPFVGMEVFPVAGLVLERGGGELPAKIELYQQERGQAPNQWKVGRSRQYSDIIIHSKRVSRLHATILEQNGQFRLRDEGSAGGTYLNKRRLEPQMPEVLAHGDLINFNIIAYRFMIEDTMSAPSSKPAGIRPAAVGGGDATEVEMIDPLFDV
jgi:pSer/pThr/pTyr-binding forkhead associated (FHA) protein